MNQMDYIPSVSDVLLGIMGQMWLDDSDTNIHIPYNEEVYDMLKRTYDVQHKLDMEREKEELRKLREDIEREIDEDDFW